MRGKVNHSENTVEYLAPKGSALVADAYHPLKFHGGPLLSAPELVSFYWGPFSASDVNTMQTYLHGVSGYLGGAGAQPASEQVLEQYGTYGATVGPFFQESVAPSSASEANVKSKILSLQASGNLPPFSAQRLFLVFTKGVTFSGYGSVWCGYHGKWGADQYFAICPFPAANGCGVANPLPAWQSITSHEIFEAATDPAPGSGWTVDNEEGGDVCSWQDTTMPFGVIQRFADNQQSSCAVWTTQQTIHGSVAAWAPNRLDLVVQGAEGAVWHRAWNGSAWTPSPLTYEFLGGAILGAPKVVAWASGRLDVFAKSSNGSLLHKWGDGSNWGPSSTGWEDLGGVLIGPPEVVSWEPGRLDVFVIGTDGGMYHKWWDGVAWRPSVKDYEPLGGVFAGPPKAVSWAPGRIDVFGRGLDLAMYHKYFDGQWHPSQFGWENLGGRLSSDLAAVSWGFRRLDIFARDTNGACSHKWFDGGSWGGWESLGGLIVGPPSVASWSSNWLDVFHRGTDNVLYHKYWDGSRWLPSVSGWENLGGTLAGAVIPVSWAPGRLDLFAEFGDGALHHKLFEGDWWPSLTEWEGLGGLIGAMGADKQAKTSGA